MKVNPKETINIVELVAAYVTTLNKRCVIHKVPKVYDVRIIKGTTVPSKEEVAKGVKPQRCKRIIFTVANTENKERLTLFSLDYVIKNPADTLKAPYKRVLYRELLFNAFGAFGFNLETSIRNAAVDKTLKDVKTYTVEDDKNSKAEEPLTVEDAIQLEITK